MYHPDKAQFRTADGKEDRSVFLKIQEAFNVLSNEQKRRAYDSQLPFDESIPSEEKVTKWVDDQYPRIRTMGRHLSVAVAGEKRWALRLLKLDEPSKAAGSGDADKKIAATLSAGSDKAKPKKQKNPKALGVDEPVYRYSWNYELEKPQRQLVSFFIWLFRVAPSCFIGYHDCLLFVIDFVTDSLKWPGESQGNSHYPKKRNSSGVCPESSKTQMTADPISCAHFIRVQKKRYEKRSIGNQ